MKNIKDMLHLNKANEPSEKSASVIGALAGKKAAKNTSNYDGKLVVAKDCEYSLNDMETKLNNNVLIVGGTGTGKTRNVVTPNIHEGSGSYFTCDPKGLLYKQYSGYLEQKGYEVKLIDFIHPELSDGYNPMDYIRNTQDILKLAEILTNSTESIGTTADPFWDRMTVILLSALIGYLTETRMLPRNFNSILTLLAEGERRSEDDKYSNLQYRFKNHKDRHRVSWASDKFAYVDCAALRTYDSIRATLAAKFSHLDTEELRQMMEKGKFSFVEVSQRKTAVFVTVSDTDRTMDTLVNIFFSQAMNELCSYADDECEGGRLPVPVRFILDDFATNCRINEFPRMISSIRSRGISAMLLIQAEAQLHQSYDKDAKTIISNCDTYVYLGGNDVETAAAVAERCDCPMMDILYLPIGQCWVFRRGSRPMLTELTDVEGCISDMVQFRKERKTEVKK